MQLEEKIKGTYKERNLFSNQAPFAIVPKIVVVDNKNAGSLETVNVMKVEVHLSIQDLDNQIVFSKYKTTSIATGKGASEAISKAIKQFKTSDPKLKSFFADADKSITTFYKNNCSKILNAARTNVDRKEYNKAYSLLKYVPESASCFKDAERMITKIYSDNKDENCRDMLHKAQLEYAQNNYTKTLYYLYFIESNSSCTPEALKILKKVEGQINKESIAEFEKKSSAFEKLSDTEKVEMLASVAEFLKIKESSAEIDN